MMIFCETCRAQGKVKFSSLSYIEKKETSFSVLDYYYKVGTYKKMSENPTRNSVTGYWPAYALSGKLTSDKAKKINCPDCNGKGLVKFKEKEKYEPNYEI